MGELLPASLGNSELIGTEVSLERIEGRVLKSKLEDEVGRLAAARRLDIFDTPEERAFEHITEVAKAALKTPAAAISLIDDDRQWFKARRGLDVSQTSREKSLCTLAIRRSGPMVVHDTLRDAALKDHPLQKDTPLIRSYAGAPLLLPDGYQVGALCVFDYRVRHFSSAEVGVLTQLAKCVVREMELRQRASLDSLTGFMSRQSFMNRLESLIDRHKLVGAPATLSIMDIDHFKTINDRFGHHTGDRVLHTMAEACFRASSDRAQFGRLGGEEFGIAFPGMDLDAAAETAMTLRATLEALRFADLPQLRVTASFGMAALHHAIPSVSAWCKVADAALYSAKEAGRNRISVWSEAAVSSTSSLWALPYLDEALKH